MRTSKKLAFLLLVSLCACGSADKGASPNVVDEGHNTVDGGGAGEGGRTCVAHGRVDEPDDKGIDENCDGADGVVGVDVYVSTTGSDTSAGLPDQPLRTIAAALKLATGRSGKVLVSSGSYPLDSIKATGSWSVIGGYGSTFVGAPKRASTSFVGGSTGILIDGAQSARLAHITVHGAAAADAKHPSAIALVSNVDKLTLDDVDLEAADALDGARGTPGAPGDPGMAGGNADTPTQLACRGMVQPAYSYGATKYLPNAEGKHPGNVPSAILAETGGEGAPGTDGADAMGTLQIVAGSIVLDQGASGVSNGRPGFGGPGGGGGTTDRDYSGGAGGSGGCPGGGGVGGASGGASIALLVLRGTVDIKRSLLHTGVAGAGGDGGEGGPGGAGGKPGLPNANPSIALPAACTASTDPAHANCAAYGGTGGIGGKGGRGGGGAGGWTIAVASAAGATTQIDDASTYELGRPGNGGTGNGGGRAPSGKSVRTYAIP